MRDILVHPGSQQAEESYKEKSDTSTSLAELSTERKYPFVWMNDYSRKMSSRVSFYGLHGHIRIQLIPCGSRRLTVSS